ncbi:hypothetical protein AUP68_08108 [Ilyonectria robusta]
MTSNQPGQCCAVGVRHEYELPTLLFLARTRHVQIEMKMQSQTVERTINGTIDAYIATPPADKAHKGVGIVYVPDILGIWVNSQLMADQFAANGYTCILPDFFNGDKFPDPRPADIMAWLSKGTDGNNPHTAEQLDPIAVAGIKALKEDFGCTKIGAVGYCLGAKVSADQVLLSTYDG